MTQNSHEINPAIGKLASLSDPKVEDVIAESEDVKDVCEKLSIGEGRKDNERVWQPATTRQWQRTKRAKWGKRRDVSLTRTGTRRTPSKTTTSARHRRSTAAPSARCPPCLLCCGEGAKGRRGDGARAVVLAGDGFWGALPRSACFASRGLPANGCAARSLLTKCPAAPNETDCAPNDAFTDTFRSCRVRFGASKKVMICNSRSYS